MATSKNNVAELKGREAQRRLSREQLLKPRISEQEVEIEALGGTVVIRSMSHETRQELRELTGFQTPDFDEDRFTMLSIVRSVVEPELTEEDIITLAKQDAAVIDELVMQITMINFLGQAGELKKGSRATQS